MYKLDKYFVVLYKLIVDMTHYSIHLTNRYIQMSHYAAGCSCKFCEILYMYTSIHGIL